MHHCKVLLLELFQILEHVLFIIDRDIQAFFLLHKCKYKLLQNNCSLFFSMVIYQIVNDGLHLLIFCFSKFLH